MKTMFAAAIALAMGTGTALADGPYAPITPFVIWIGQNAAGMPLTPMPELMRMAHNGERLNSAPTPRAFAQQPSAQGAAVES